MTCFCSDLIEFYDRSTEPAYANYIKGKQINSQMGQTCLNRTTKKITGIANSDYQNG